MVRPGQVRERKFRFPQEFRDKAGELRLALQEAQPPPEQQHPLLGPLRLQEPKLSLQHLDQQVGVPPSAHYL
jgi:hypothetical protein